MINNLLQGVCIFDREGRLILSNPRYAEIYHLAPEHVRPGATLTEITERQMAAGTSPMATHAWTAVSETRTTALKDGRTIQIRRQPTPEGGWAATHEDITELDATGTLLKATRTVANERVTLQTLIDFLPDNLWVKDVKSRFVFCNKATVSRMGYENSSELIGKTDLELLSPDIAEKFFADEQTIVRTGQPMIDIEECVFGIASEKIWILTTKVPLRDDQGEIFGLAGISRDITERRRLAAEMEYRSVLLHAVSAAAKELLTAPAIEIAIATALKTVGEAVRADRLIVFERQTPPGGAPALELRYAWHSPRAPVILDATGMGDSSGALADPWFAPLGDGLAVSARPREMPDGAAKSIFLSLGVRSVLLVPITVGGKIWGFIGFDDCTTEREWSSAELDILKIVADMIGSAIIRERYVEDLKNANTIVESSPTVLFRLRGDPSLPLIYVSHNVTKYGYDPEVMIAGASLWRNHYSPRRHAQNRGNIVAVGDGGKQARHHRISHAVEGWDL